MDGGFNGDTVFQRRPYNRVILGVWFTIIHMMVPGDTGQFLLRYTLYISWFLEIQDSSFSGIHYIYHGSLRYRTVPSQEYITYIMVPGDSGQFLIM